MAQQTVVSSRSCSEASTLRTDSVVGGTSTKVRLLLSTQVGPPAIHELHVQFTAGPRCPLTPCRPAKGVPANEAGKRLLSKTAHRHCATSPARTATQRTFLNIFFSPLGRRGWRRTNNFFLSSQKAREGTSCLTKHSTTPTSKAKQEGRKGCRASTRASSPSGRPL